MTREEIQREFLQRYSDIVQSGDTDRMERLGAMVKRIMAWLIKYEPGVAEQAVRMLGEYSEKAYTNMMTEPEAQDIVRQMEPQPTWTLQGLADALQGAGLPMDVPPHFNQYALLVTMMMVQSDEGDPLREALHASDRDERLLRLVYKLAVCRLEDADGRFNVRRYFGMEE